MKSVTQSFLNLVLFKQVASLVPGLCRLVAPKGLKNRLLYLRSEALVEAHGTIKISFVAYHHAQGAQGAQVGVGMQIEQRDCCRASARSFNPDPVVILPSVSQKCSVSAV